MSISTDLTSILFSDLTNRMPGRSLHYMDCLGAVKEQVTRIVLVGAGFVGLVFGACIAEFGHHVVCVDNDLTKVGVLRCGESPIFERGLEELVRSNIKAGTLFFSTAVEKRDAEAAFIAVGTASRREDGHADLFYVFQAAGVQCASR